MGARVFEYLSDYQGEPLALILVPPDWGQPVELVPDLSTLVEIETSPSALESSRAFGRSARYTFTFTGALRDARECTDFRLGMRRLKSELTALPLWTDQVELRTAAAAGATTLAFVPEFPPARWGREWVIVSRDGSAYEIVVVTAVDAVAGTLTLAGPGTVNAWPVDAVAAPLLFGRFPPDRRPQLPADTDESADLPITLPEDSDFSRRINPAPSTLVAVGAEVPRFTGTKLWTVRPSFERPLDETEVDLLLANLGFGREQAVYEYPQPARAGLRMDFTMLSRAQIAWVESMLVAMRGTVRRFLLPSFRGDLRLAANVTAGVNNFQIEPSRYSDPAYADTHPGAPYLALIDPQNIRPAQATGVAGTTVTLAANVAQAATAAATIVSQLLFVRLAEAKLKWSYTGGAGDADTSVQFLERSEEYNQPRAILPEDVWLYRITEQVPDAPQVARFTSYEAAFTTSEGETFTPAHMSHGSIKTSLKLDKEELTLKTFDFPGNPIKKSLPFALEAPLLLEVLRADALDPATPPKPKFSGELQKPEWDAKNITVKALALGRRLELKFPNFLVQRPCNYTLYTPLPACGVVEADWTRGAVVQSIFPGATQIVVAVTDGFAADKYPGGILKLVGDGGLQRRSILDAAAAGDGALLLTLGRPVNASEGNGCTVAPGCDQSPDRCKFFENYAHYGGVPFAPDHNIAIDAAPADQNQGGKGGGK